MWKLLTALCLLTTLLALSGCATGLIGPASAPPVVVSDYCRIAAPISYDSQRDTPETVKAIEVHNSRWVKVCESQ